MNTDQQRVARIEARLLQVAGNLAESPLAAELERRHLAQVAAGGISDSVVAAAEARVASFLEAGSFAAMANPFKAGSGPFLLSRCLRD